jgi:nucleotide-binding universal stress UspA family protein
MKRFKNILYVTEYKDEESEALRDACTLAQENGARLTIASVMPDLPKALPIARLAELRADIQSVEQHRQGFVFSEVLLPFRADGLDISHHVLSGIPFIEIIRDVLLKKRDLVVIPSSPLFDNGCGFSSLVMHLMRKCPCPVWAIRTNHHTPFQRVLAAIDAGETGPVNQALNADILKVATSQAKRDNAEVHAVHVWEVEGEALLRGPLVELPDADWHSLHKDTHAVHLQRFEDTIERNVNFGVELTTHLVEGSPAEIIPKCTEELRADLLIMGTLSHGGIEGYFMGATSEEILQRTSCSVLAMKPVSFVSPVVARPPVGSAVSSLAGTTTS